MEPGIIALICAASFGVVATIVAFVRQILLSRDKKLNDEAQKRALSQEVAELTAMREQMQQRGRTVLDYQIFGENKVVIENLDREIDEKLKAKMELIKRYADISIKESQAIVEGKFSKERKEDCDKLRLAIDAEMKAYDEQIAVLQGRRKRYWETYVGLQTHILAQENARNERLDMLYQQHTALLEKVFLRHIDNTESVANQGTQAATSTFHSMIMAPIQFLMQYFGLSSGIAVTQVNVEQQARDGVDQAEQDANDNVPVERDAPDASETRETADQLRSKVVPA